MACWGKSVVCIWEKGSVNSGWQLQVHGIMSIRMSSGKDVSWQGPHLTHKIAMRVGWFK